LNSRSRDRETLSLGPDVIRHLLPHRRPFLMVDSISGYRRGDRPVLWATRQISANEPVFEGHYPGLHLWPGVYTIEGLGQTSLLLEVLLALEQAFVARGKSAEDLLAALRNLELGYRLHPGYRPGLSKLLGEFAELEPPLGISASIEMRFLEPVFAGQCLEYCVTRTQIFDERFMRFEVEASVDARPVARGTMVGAIGTKAPALEPR
jgi:3-hydroxyacyl-[acyl-carrier-protein] dehydratase